MKLAEPLLFNLTSDVGEEHNVLDQNPQIVSRLQQQAERIRAELGDVTIAGSDQHSINLVDPQERP